MMHLLPRHFFLLKHLIHSFIYLFIHSFMHSFVHLFIYFYDMYFCFVTVQFQDLWRVRKPVNMIGEFKLDAFDAVIKVV